MAEKHRKQLGNVREANNEFANEKCSANNNTDDSTTTLLESPRIQLEDSQGVRCQYLSLESQKQQKTGSPTLAESHINGIARDYA